MQAPPIERERRETETERERDRDREGERDTCAWVLVTLPYLGAALALDGRLCQYGVRIEEGALIMIKLN